MSERPEEAGPPPTVVVQALVNEDAADVRTVKRSLLARLQDAPAGSGPTPEELLGQWPTNPAVDRDAASLIYQDFCRQRRQGSASNLDDYQKRFPEHAESLASLARQDDFQRSM